MAWSIKPNEPMRTNCQFCGKFEQPGHLCAGKHDAQLQQEQADETAVKEAEAKFRREREIKQLAERKHREADAYRRLNAALKALAAQERYEQTFGR